MAVPVPGSPACRMPPHLRLRGLGVSLCLELYLGLRGPGAVVERARDSASPEEGTRATITPTVRPFAHDLWLFVLRKQHFVNQCLT
jgi:hypothetical protein